MDPTILAFDACSEACSAALFSSRQTAWRFQVSPRQHHRLLLPMIESLLDEERISLSECDAIAISHGPGSFTGLRIAVGVAQGLALAAKLPVITVSSLQMMAQSCYRRFGATSVLTALDAHMGQIYVGDYQLTNEGVMMATLADTLVDYHSISFLLAKEEPLLLAGSCWQACGIDKEKISHAQFIADCLPAAEDMKIPATKKFLAKDYHQGDNIFPNYLRQKNAWKVSG